MSIFTKNKMKKIVTHSGIFHPDEVFAVATICLAHKKKPSDFEIIRTRDEQIIATGDIVVDVSGVHDESRDRFDHHQVGGAGARENGVPYASFGLVWRRYGSQAVENVAGKIFAAKIQADIDERLVSPLDMTDNGKALVTATSVPGILPFTLEDVIFGLLPNWDEKNVDTTERFVEAVVMAIEILKRLILRTASKYDAIGVVEADYEASEDKRIAVLSESLPWKGVMVEKPSAVFVVIPEADRKSWRVHAIPVAEHSFERRRLLPEAWGGKRDAELATMTHVPDAIFCHNGRFIAGAKSKEGALALAKLAL